MKHKGITTALICLSAFVCAVASTFAGGNATDDAHATKYPAPIKKHSTIYAGADHSTFKILQQKFKTGDDVTKACITCHTTASDDMKKSVHWTWQSDTNKELGKSSNTLNNYCISANGEKDKACYDCHVGWKGKEGEINCLVCHSQTIINWSESIEDATAMEADGDAESLEMAAEVREELTASIVDLGKPGVENCGSCHFKGGGGDGTKHGDLDTSLINASRFVDVHLSPDGADMSCVDCHTTTHHNIAGRDYDKPASDVAHRKSLTDDYKATKVNCISCHSEVPHTEKRLNDHSSIIACVTCHVPTLAPVLPTQTEWDWSTAGKLKDGKGYAEYGKYEKWHRKEYKSMKGTFVWEKDVVPTYMWYDGSFTNMTLKDTIDPTSGEIIDVNKPLGAPYGKGSKISPFKHHLTNMPYDTVHKTFLAPLLSTPEGYWKTFDWQSAFTLGQKSLNLPYSGKFDFVMTNYYYPTPHMVRPAADALSCIDCHSQDGRLKGVKDVYIPGNHGNKALDIFGILFVLVSGLGVGLHGLMRFIMSRKRKG